MSTNTNIVFKGQKALEASIVLAFLLISQLRNGSTRRFNLRPLLKKLLLNVSFLNLVVLRVSQDCGDRDKVRVKWSSLQAFDLLAY